MPRVLLIDPDRTLQRMLAVAPGLDDVELEAATGEADALSRLRRRAYAVVVSNPSTTVTHDLALVHEIRHARPGVRVILLAPQTTPEEVIAALRQRVFACFSGSQEIAGLADMVRKAVDAEEWRDGIEVVSAQRDWVSLRVACRLLTAERLVHYLGELRSDLPAEEREELLTGFREVLLNAMEHGAAFDPDQVVEVAAVRTARAVVFYVRDPGPGFGPDALAHAAVANPPGNPVAHIEQREKMGLRPGGFGLLIARQVVDEMIHSERGNEVLMIKHTR